MSLDCLVNVSSKSKSTLSLSTETATACTSDMGSGAQAPPRKDSDSTLVGDSFKLLDHLPFGDVSPSRPSSVSSVNTRVSCFGALDIFHASLRRQDDQVFVISSPAQLKQLLDFFYSAPEPLAPSSAVFPFLHGMSQIKQRIYFHDKFDPATDLDILNYPPDELAEMFPHDLSSETPQIPFNLMTINTLDTDRPQLMNSISFKDILTYKNDSCFDKKDDYDTRMYKSFSEVHDLEDPPACTQELLNRNFHLQARHMASLSHFVIYNNVMNRSANMKAVNVIKKLKSEHQAIYVVEFAASEWPQCTPYLEDDVSYSIGSLSPFLKHEPYQKKLQVMEQQLMWQLNGTKELFPKLYIGNVFNFKSLETTKHNFKLHVHCHENAKLPSLDALRLICSSLNSGKSYETYYLEFPNSIAKYTTELSPTQVLSYVNVLKIIHTIVVKQKAKAFIYSFDGFTSLSLLILSLSMLWTADSVEEAALNIFRKPAFKLYLYREDFSFLRQFEPYILWLRKSCISSTNQLELQLPLQEIAEMPRAQLDCFDWFEEGKDINFPAYIYETLFLGSAAHSSSVTVLATLGIKRLISVDKLPIWYHLLSCVLEHEAPPFEADVIKPIFSFNNDKAKVYEIPVPEEIRRILKFEVTTILYIYNVRDDGKDSMLPLLLECPEHVQRKLLVNPEEASSRTLLHCRVGVSRSATLAIASVMKHFHMDVLESYLYVRVRRFNVVIQPNLRLFYELFLYDEMLQRNRDKNFRRKHCWWVVCDQIARLNQSYAR
ncbi:hypothetical protein CJI97_000875 [Candidozyma auris]|nr:hypothetical protein CJI97_000875 [[Candida] auris]